MKRVLLIMIIILGISKLADAQTWSALGTGVSGVGSYRVHALAVYNGELYAGGTFVIAGGLAANNIAKWNGTAWSAVGTGTNGSVRALAVYNGELYAGGIFTTAGGVSANNIAKWNGTSWAALGSGVTGSTGIIRSLAVYNSELYAGGDFTTAGGLAVNDITRWNGTAWSAAGTGVANGTLNATVFALTVHNNELYLGGSFITAGGLSALRVAKWDGSNYSPLGPGLSSSSGSGTVYCLTSYNNDIYAGGNLFSASSTGDHLYKWNGVSWSTVGGSINGTGSTVDALAVFNNELYASGSFLGIGSISATRIAKWNGTNWSAMGSGLDYPAYAFQVHNNDLYVGGDFLTAGGVSASCIAKWSTCTAPPATITASGATTFCQGSSVVLNANSGTGYTHQWKLNGNNITGGTGASYTAAAAGIYTVVVTSNGCSATSTSTTVTTNPLPTPVITQAGNTLSTAAGQGTYQWYKNAAVIPAATANSYTVTQSGSYYVRVTNTNNCTGQSNAISVANVGINDPHPLLNVKLYPNPAKSKLFLHGLAAQKDGKINIEILSVTGYLITKGAAIIKNSTIYHEIQLPFMSPGIYFIKLSSLSSSQVCQFVKQ
jgi:hypothetical protein